MSEDEHKCLDLRSEGEHRIVTLGGSCFVDDDHIRDIGMQLRAAVDEADGKYFLVNLKNISVLSSMMIGQLVHLRNKCAESERVFQVCDLSPNVAESLKIMNLESLLNVYGSESDALACDQ